jgi:hypothetical protein
MYISDVHLRCTSQMYAQNVLQDVRATSIVHSYSTSDFNADRKRYEIQNTLLEWNVPAFHVNGVFWIFLHFWPAFHIEMLYCWAHEAEIEGVQGRHNLAEEIAFGKGCEVG